MKPLEKAEELVDKFSIVGLQQRNEGIQCALIAVDLVLDNLEDHTGEDIKYYQEVKQEIEKL